MSGWIDTGRLLCVVIGKCPLFDSGPFFSPLFILIDYYPTYINTALTIICIYTWEFAFLYVWICMLIDFGLNAALRAIINTPNRFPDCGSYAEMPSYATELIILLNTLAIGFVLLFNRNVMTYKIAVMNFVTLLVIFARVYIGINTILELVIGSIIGVVEGIIYSIILYKCRGYFAKLLKLRFVIDLGLVDTMCGLSTNEKKEKS